MIEKIIKLFEEAKPEEIKAEFSKDLSRFQIDKEGLSFVIWKSGPDYVPFCIDYSFLVMKDGHAIKKYSNYVRDDTVKYIDKKRLEEAYNTIEKKIMEYRKEQREKSYNL
jgi:hypothetical protein